MNRLEKVLRAQPWLVLYNYNNITDRFQTITDGDMFIAFNRLKSRYEIHSVWSFFRDPQSISMNGALGQPWLNGWLITDFLATNNLRFAEEKEDEREYRERVLEEHEERMAGSAAKIGLAKVQDILGRQL